MPFGIITFSIDINRNKCGTTTNTMNSLGMSSIESPPPMLFPFASQRTTDSGTLLHVSF